MVKLNNFLVLVTLLGVTLGYSNVWGMNLIDGCWRKDPQWSNKRMRLADCAKGFGSRAFGGKGGRIYTVTRPHDDPVNPQPRTLRYAVTRKRPLWIVFSRSMKIRLKMPLLVTSHKTIDGRGFSVHIAKGPCIYLYNVSNVIIHGLHIHHCVRGAAGLVLWQESYVETVAPTDGDAVSVIASKHVWIDHNNFYKGVDGLVDVTLGSTSVTISNNHFSNHDKVMLLGHDDHYSTDKNMKVTVAFNHFGPGCGQRMPRVRYGFAHVANNYYEPWGIYAIGGSMGPSIRSEGNRFMAPTDRFKKQVTARECSGGSCKGWRWRSVRDGFMNGAYFIESAGARDPVSPGYDASQRFSVLHNRRITTVTNDAGVLTCYFGRPCY